jgi:hypothetical protein
MQARGQVGQNMPAKTRHLGLDNPDIKNKLNAGPPGILSGGYQNEKKN